ncbi:MAG: hypothetical protein JST54_32300 [Deltaproteobacteria bacterium]|nr:hypothetical protein [Deltaproteobacteria bacterium]
MGSPALANPPPTLTPRTATGFSTIEQRWVYAPPDEGEFSFPLTPGAGAPREVLIQEPEMCAGSATVRVNYSKSRDVVNVDLDIHGLPYRMSYTRPVDISTPYDQFPVSVQNGKWQLWFVESPFRIQTTFYYDSHTLQLIGSEVDVPNPPVDAIPVLVPTLQMVSSPIWEGRPDGEAHVRLTWDYHQLIDKDGNAGVQVAFLPFNLLYPDQYGTYYTHPLPLSKTMSWDDVLSSIWEGYGFDVATSLEPDPKPAYLESRDNPMIGWAGGYPQYLPAGIAGDPINGTVSIRETCQTHIAQAFPSSYFTLGATGGLVVIPQGP